MFSDECNLLVQGLRFVRRSDHEKVMADHIDQRKCFGVAFHIKVSCAMMNSQRFARKKSGTSPKS